jgi:hypothetical protein
MKANFKPLGLAAAVATASAGYAGVVNADAHLMSVANNGLGDLALIPYYTVQDNWGTGVHVINSSNRTQVVKLRFRRGSDSLDALDFNLVLSPYDEWTGFMNDTDGTIAVTSQDSSCTAPLFEDGRFEMPNIYRSGADEGYIEVIAMGSPEFVTTATSPTIPVDGQALSVNAKHKPGGAPLNCQYVENNFLDAYLGSATDIRGIHSNTLSAGEIDTFAADGSVASTAVAVTSYEDGGDVLKVSWFIRDADSGIEFGNDAVHIAGFSNDAMMTHQEEGKFSGNLRGFDFPDLDGGAPFQDSTTKPSWVAGSWTNEHQKYVQIRSGGVLGVSAVLNDWSNNADLNVGTDWIVTIPGQYLMLDQPLYWLTLGNPGGLDTSTPGGVIGGAVDSEGNPILCLPGVCDFRDLPVRAELDVWDREENYADAPPGDRDVVISPSLPGAAKPTTLLRYEVNVIHWGEEVLASDYDEVDVSGLLDLLDPAVSGWAKLGISSATSPTGGNYQALCEWDGDYFNSPTNVPGGPTYDPNDPMSCSPVSGQPPMIGYVAWERSFPANPDGNYGRAVNHSFESGSD